MVNDRLQRNGYGRVHSNGFCGRRSWNKWNSWKVSLRCATWDELCDSPSGRIASGTSGRSRDGHRCVTACECEDSGVVQTLCRNWPLGRWIDGFACGCERGPASCWGTETIGHSGRTGMNSSLKIPVALSALQRMNWNKLTKREKKNLSCRTSQNLCRSFLPKSLPVWHWPPFEHPTVWSRKRAMKMSQRCYHLRHSILPLLRRWNSSILPAHPSVYPVPLSTGVVPIHRQVAVQCDWANDSPTRPGRRTLDDNESNRRVSIRQRHHAGQTCGVANWRRLWTDIRTGSKRRLDSQQTCVQSNGPAVWEACRTGVHRGDTDADIPPTLDGWPREIEFLLQWRRSPGTWYTDSSWAAAGAVGRGPSVGGPSSDCEREGNLCKCKFAARLKPFHWQSNW